MNNTDDSYLIAYTGVSPSRHGHFIVMPWAEWCDMTLEARRDLAQIAMSDGFTLDLMCLDDEDRGLSDIQRFNMVTEFNEYRELKAKADIS